VIPTTVACAVDAGIGGKTAVNTKAGKNTAGRLWDPDGVICDPSCFATLPGPVLADGLAEVIKVGCSHDPGLIDAIISGPWPAAGHWLDPVVVGSAQVAVDVASGRYGPGDNPDVLSLGHEIAHALESLSEYRIGHGAAVSVGLRFSQNLLGPDTYRVTPESLDQVLSYCGLPLTARQAGFEADWPSVRAELTGDKRMAGRLRFLVALKEGTFWSDDIDEHLAEHMWDSKLRK
jgi:3-dehydroquinate synthase